jgi:hypothetical protein
MAVCVFQFHSGSVMMDKMNIFCHPRKRVWYSRKEGAGQESRTGRTDTHAAIGRSKRPLQRDYRSRRAHIPMEIGATKPPARPLRHIKARAIRAHPQVRRLPKLGERLVHPPRRAFGREGWMLKVSVETRRARRFRSVRPRVWWLVSLHLKAISRRTAAGIPA